MKSGIANGITANLAIGIVVTVLTIFGTAWWMAEQHDKHADEALQRMVVGGVDLTRRRLEAITNDYGWWEEAYLAYKRGDTEWMNANIGTGITGTQIADALAVVNPDGTVNTAWTVDETPDAWRAIFTPELVERTRRLIADSKVDRLAARSMFYRIDDKVFLISVQRITPVSKADQVVGTDLPLVVFATQMTGDRLQDMGRQYLISNLELVSMEPRVESEDTGAKILKDADDKPIGRLQWTSPRPGRELLEKLATPMIGAVLVFVLVAVLISLRARRMAQDLSRSEQEAVAASRTDSLTGLLNRAGFNSLLDSIEYRQACRTGQAVVIYVDVNDFKGINDSLGHQGGDKIIVDLARRFQEAVGQDGHLARIGGDEFVILISGPDAQPITARIIDSLARVIEAPFTVGTHVQHVHCAIGYALAPPASSDLHETLRRADVAMYYAKTARERYGVRYESSMDVGADEKRKVEDILRAAIANGELSLVYQPILNVETGRILRAEALVRLNSPIHGTIRPDVFIPIAEKTGLIDDVGAFVLEQACKDMARMPDLGICINISPVQLRDPTFIDSLSEIVNRHGIDPKRLELELTEGVLVAVPTIANRRLRDLKKLGFSLALDDFGTGFSSIGYLGQFPFDCLKIDKSFIANLGQSAKGNALVHSLISLCRAMDLEVTAEGVETEAHNVVLRSIGCTWIQGYFISRPVGLDDLLAFCANWNAQAPQPQGQDAPINLTAKRSSVRRLGGAR